MWECASHAVVLVRPDWYDVRGVHPLCLFPQPRLVERLRRHCAHSDAQIFDVVIRRAEATHHEADLEVAHIAEDIGCKLVRPLVPI
jgi:hypothetical protein